MLVFRGEVLTPIELDGQVSSCAEEVQDKWATGVLTTELEAAEAMATKVTPKQGLGVGRVAAKLPSAS